MLQVLGACSSIDGHNLVPGQSTVNDVVATMGPPADKRIGPQGETIFWYPQLPWGHASYAALIAPDGRLIHVEQRLTEANISKVVKGVSATEVRDLLGPPFEPGVYHPLEREIWTYPMRIQGASLPKWFVVQLSLDDHTVRETYLMDDPNFTAKDGCCRRN
ncbi:MAG: hypothetical protein JO292_11240 [Betaproteobacteria bacterium]|nr:hypothetical protein [Betaproteobacteria bacterium]MBV9361953.1 hypothetical protein [Betaproteobacteria bacterium]